MSTASEAAHLEAAAAAAMAHEDGMDVELPALPAEAEDMPPALSATGGEAPAAAAAAASAAGGGAMEAEAEVPAVPVSFYAVRPPMGPTDTASSIATWGVFPSQPAAEAYAATLSPAEVPANDDGEEAEGGADEGESSNSATIQSFGDAMSAIVYASRGTVAVSSVISPHNAALLAGRGSRKKKKKRKKRDEGVTSVYTGAVVGGKAANSSETKRRKPYKQWEVNYQRVAALKERTGGFAVNPEEYHSEIFADVDASAAADEEVGPDGTPKRPKRNSADKLRRWMSDQRTEYKQYQKGEKSGMTEEKIARLQQIGFDWDTAPLPIGRPRVREEDAAAADAAAAAAAGGGGGFVRAPRGTLTEEERRKAKHMRKRPPKPLSAEKKADWDRMYGEFLAFREEYGHSNVNTTEKNELAKWVSKQRYEYKLLKEDKHSLLTTNQLMKLQDAGFVFAPRGSSYLSWSERIDQLKAWKDEKGHLKIPVNDPELGSFVKAQREAHRRRVGGEETNMTDERYNDLLELGFIFEAGKRHVGPRGPTKTWEERFQDLLAYREEYGHCGVPQHYPGLGYWVHAQRNGYRMLKEGKKTAMTAEKALKLADVGFIFDAKKGKRRSTEGGGGGDGDAGTGGGGGNMNAAVGLAVAAHGHHHGNPPPLGGHLAPHHLAGYHYDHV